MFDIFGRINRFIEKHTGAADLDEAKRRDFAVEQLNAMIEILPMVALGSSIVITTMVLAALGSSVSQLVTVWAGLLLFLHTMRMRSWLNWQETVTAPKAFDVGIKRICYHAVFAGSAWGVLPIITFPVGDPNLSLVTTVAVSGIMCGAGFAFSSVPQASLAFVAPLATGSLLAVGLAGSNASTPAVTILLSAYLFLIPFISMRNCRSFCRHVSAEAALREQQNLVGLLLNEYEENSSDWLWETDSTGKLVRTSARLEHASKAEISDGDTVFTDLLGEAVTNKVFLDRILQQFSARKPFRDLELPLELDGEQAWWKLTGKPVFDSSGEFKGYIGIGSDFTAEKTAEKKISKLAHTDPLTGLLNRASFNEEMDRVAARLERFGSEFALMFLDLDRFKLINDTRGHLVGDELLRMVSKRIQSSVRTSDFVARLGGDEFAVIMTDKCDAGSAAHLASDLISQVSRPYEIDGEHHSIGVSIGIALAPMNGTRPNQILRNADLALYRSKADGRGVFRFFESQMDADEREKRMLELELSEAIENNEFELVYQPLIATETGLPTCMEALIRWHHPMRGMISPDEFIPIAEQSSLIQRIGSWSIKNACNEAKKWPEEVVVAVNLSAQHFIGADIVNLTKDALQETGLPAHRLELEITESLLINNTEEVLKILGELKELGVNIALDDFGTGYSSLSYILKFPFDKIKIDRSFVMACGDEEAARSILKMISTLGESLDIKITAEGVETKEQFEFLQSINCYQFQGFLFAKPLNAEDLPDFFSNTESRLPDFDEVGNSAQKIRNIA